MLPLTRSNVLGVHRSVDERERRARTISLRRRSKVPRRQNRHRRSRLQNVLDQIRARRRERDGPFLIKERPLQNVLDQIRARRRERDGPFLIKERPLQTKEHTGFRFERNHQPHLLASFIFYGSRYCKRNRKGYRPPSRISRTWLHHKRMHFLLKVATQSHAM